MVIQFLRLQFELLKQRLEFLGDAVLDYLMTSYLYFVYPKLKPGQLTDLRCMSVNNNSFAGIAINREFHKYIMCESSDLRKSMDEYVKYINISRTSSFDDDQVEAPRCPKVFIINYFLFYVFIVMVDNSWVFILILLWMCCKKDLKSC